MIKSCRKLASCCSLSHTRDVVFPGLGMSHFEKDGNVPSEVGSIPSSVLHHICVGLSFNETREEQLAPFCYLPFEIRHNSMRVSS